MDRNPEKNEEAITEAILNCLKANQDLIRLLTDRLLREHGQEKGVCEHGNHEGKDDLPEAWREIGKRRR